MCALDGGERNVEAENAGRGSEFEGTDAKKRGAKRRRKNVAVDVGRNSEADDTGAKNDVYDGGGKEGANGAGCIENTYGTSGIDDAQDAA